MLKIAERGQINKPGFWESIIGKCCPPMGLLCLQTEGYSLCLPSLINLVFLNAHGWFIPCCKTTVKCDLAKSHYTSLSISQSVAILRDYGM